ncbi:MAG: Ig-like domain-containing protein, partial [Lachnospiraceae bacterium]|nr:Ig-like domain-containing protein [Lachnospiraceae bacterium]
DADMCAENIAVGDQTAQQVMNSWMNSQGHRQNILLEDATTIGIGCFVHNGVLYWTQCFGTGSDTVDCSSPANTTVTQKIALATEKFDEASTGTGVDFSFGESVAYEYKFQLQLEKNSIKAGENTMAKLCVVNPGFSSARAVLNPEGVTFSSSDQKVAKVDSAGTVNGVAKGSATITGAMTYYNASGTLTVSAVTASQQETLTSKEIAKVKKQLPKGKVQSVKKIKKTSLRVTCKKMKQVSGYQVRLSKNKKMTKAKVLTAKKRQVTFKKLKKNQKYYIQVRVYKKVSGKKVYGKWGTVKKVKL